MRKWFRVLAGPNPALRLIALLLVVIAVLLFLILRAAVAIEGQMVEPCGTDAFAPCYVQSAS